MTDATLWPTVAFRVPPDVREDLEKLAERDGHAHNGRPNLTPHGRQALRDYVDREFGRTNPPPILANLDGQPRSHRNGPTTERMAALRGWPKVNSDRRRVLRALDGADDDGMTADQLAVRLNMPTAPRRLTELKQGGWAAVLTIGAWEGDSLVDKPARRRTRTGNFADVYVLTKAARDQLAKEAYLPPFESVAP